MENHVIVLFGIDETYMSACFSDHSCFRDGKVWAQRTSRQRQRIKITCVLRHWFLANFDPSACNVWQTATQRVKQTKVHCFSFSLPLFLLLFLPDSRRRQEPKMRRNFGKLVVSIQPFNPFLPKVHWKWSIVSWSKNVNNSRPLILEKPSVKN